MIVSIQTLLTCIIYQSGVSCFVSTFAYVLMKEEKIGLFHKFTLHVHGSDSFNDDADSKIDKKSIAII